MVCGKSPKPSQTTAVIEHDPKSDLFAARFNHNLQAVHELSVADFDRLLLAPEASGSYQARAARGVRRPAAR